jgi:hypothetical protein
MQYWLPLQWSPTALHSIGQEQANSPLQTSRSGQLFQIKDKDKDELHSIELVEVLSVAERFPAS